MVIPSLSVDSAELRKIFDFNHYEERLLFNLMLLRHPRMHVIFLTSKRLNPLMFDYCLHQTRGVPASHARRHLTLLDCDDASARPLAQKLLERPRLLGRLCAGIADSDMAHLMVFNFTPLDRSVAVQPSAQIRISPLGDVVPVSTHDQRLGIDFLVLPRCDGDEVYAVEINLRQGGTTHPFNTLKFLTNGTYDQATGAFLTTQGRRRSYVATDVLQRPEYVGILPFDLGVVFHLLGCLSEHGRVGCTAIGRDLTEAQALYDETVDVLD